jgi:hypothetical protein
MILGFCATQEISREQSLIGASFAIGRVERIVTTMWPGYLQDVETLTLSSKLPLTLVPHFVDFSTTLEMFFELITFLVLFPTAAREYCRDDLIWRVLREARAEGIPTVLVYPDGTSQRFGS